MNLSSVEIFESKRELEFELRLGDFFKKIQMKMKDDVEYAARMKKEIQALYLHLFHISYDVLHSLSDSLENYSNPVELHKYLVYRISDIFRSLPKEISSKSDTWNQENWPYILAEAIITIRTVDLLTDLNLTEGFFEKYFPELLSRAE